MDFKALKATSRFGTQFLKGTWCRACSLTALLKQLLLAEIMLNRDGGLMGGKPWMTCF